MNRIRRPFLTSILILVLMLVFSYSASADEDPPLPDLFSAVDQQGRSVSLDHDHPEVIRGRTTEVDFSLLETIGRSAPRPDTPVFVLNLFDDIQFEVTISQTEQFPSGAVGLVGTVDHPEFNELVMVTQDGVLHAYLQVGQQAFEIRFSRGSHQIVEVDQSAYPDSLPAVAPRNPDGTDLDGSAVRGESFTARDSGDTIDVLAVYTPAAVSNLGSALAVETRIQESILSANTGYQNSGVTQRLNLVGMEEVAYDESESIVPDTGAGETWNQAAWYYALDRLTFGHYRTDPVDANYLADARSYREIYGADLVFMVTDLPYIYCGLGWVAGAAGDAAYGYSVLQVNCTGASAFSAQHEMGHNMGACHDWGNTSDNSRAYCWDDYAYGYQQTNQFYTVMAYSSGCGTCSRINRWSNPALTYNGYPTSGLVSGQTVLPNNALALNNTAFNVANWRQSVDIISAGFTTPAEGSYVLTPRTYLRVDASSLVGGITSVAFHAEYDGSWHLLDTDLNGSDGWEILWGSGGISEQDVNLKAVVTDSAANTAEIYRNSIPLTSQHTSVSGYQTRSGGREEAFAAAESVNPASETDSPAPIEDIFPTPLISETPQLVSPYPFESRRIRME